MAIKATPVKYIMREQFAKYERVRKRGKFNMFFPEAQRATGLSLETFWGIIEHYGELAARYPDVRTTKSRKK